MTRTGRSPPQSESRSAEEEGHSPPLRSGSLLGGHPMMTTHVGGKPGKPKKKRENSAAKPQKKRKGRAAKPRLAELAYLRQRGQSVDDAESRRRESTLKVPFRLGPNLATELGRECARERAGFLPWLRQQTRDDAVGALAAALRAHESSLLDGERVPDSWVKILSRITRGRIQHLRLGPSALRAAVEQAREEFRALPREEEMP